MTCLGGASKQNDIFSETVLPKKHPCPQCLEKTLNKSFTYHKTDLSAYILRIDFCFQYTLMDLVTK